MSNNKFTSNTAKSSGGAGYIEGKFISITGNTFTSNKAKNGNGGGLRVYANKATVTKNTFSKNTAKKGSGLFGTGNYQKVRQNKYKNNKGIWNKYKEPTKFYLVQKSVEFNVKNKQIKVKLKDSDGDNLKNRLVTFYINGNHYTKRTNSNGAVVLNVLKSKITTYKFTVRYGGESLYQSKKSTFKFYVTKINTKLTAPTKVYNNTTKKSLSVTLKTSSGKVIKGKKIILTINGTKYKATTNSNGKATFSLKITTPDIYTYTVKFGGDKSYSKVTSKGKITVC